MKTKILNLVLASLICLGGLFYTNNSFADVSYEYYEGTWDVLPDFDSLTPVRTGTQSGFAITPNSADGEHFAFRFRALLTVTTTETYTFRTTSDDGSKLFIDGTLVVNNDGLHDTTTVSGDISLTPNNYIIEVQFFEKTGGDNLTVEWETAAISREVIPAGSLNIVPPVVVPPPYTPTAGEIANIPLFLTDSVDPRVMLAMSNDHQLHGKAYTDYSDLNGDGTLDTTYNDGIDYYGYFNSNRCYSYASSLFSPEGLVDDPKVDDADTVFDHYCSTADRWSGNFLNWATMTRMDVVRKVLYGGYRSTDISTSTILQRSLIPDDVHAFAKVYTTSTTVDMEKLTPYAKTAITLCNYTPANDFTRDVDRDLFPPVFKVVSGVFPQWADTNLVQCQWGPSTSIPSSSVRLANPDIVVRVEVCVPGKEETNCKIYGSNSKPTGLLQKYGEHTLSRPIRFGLMTGSYQKNKSGGVLRRNLERITGDTVSTSKNEIDTTTGIFINQGSTNEGIINTLNRIRISSYNYTSNRYENGCNSPGILSFSDGSCVDWGNPLSEIYLETLRYLAGKSSPTTAFSANDSSFMSLSPVNSWIDPMPAAEFCADTSIITLSTGLNSFDTDQLVNDLSIDANSVTDTVGTLEGISGNYLVGEHDSNDDNSCTSKTVTNLSKVKGICPEVPSIEGGYHLAGLAYYSRITDLRSDRTGDQIVTNYSVALAESLPRFDISVGTEIVTILPACGANSSGSAGLSSSGWRECSLTGVTIEDFVYDSNGKLVAGSLQMQWEDSTWGNDYDLDGTSRLLFCSGPTNCANFTASGKAICPTTSASSSNISWGVVGTNQVAIASCVIQADAGHALRFGYIVTGTSGQDGINFNILRPGGNNFPLGSRLPSTVTNPDVDILNQGTSTAKLLENPLWYMAKYGGFNIDDEEATLTNPNVQQWDADNDGVPDRFFKATNPADLEDSLDAAFSDVIKRIGSFSAVATNSTRLDTNTKLYQAQFNSADWSGNVFAFPINSDGTINETVAWTASEGIPTESLRNIYSYDPTATGNKGIVFEWANLNTTVQQPLLNVDIYGNFDSLGEDRLDYVRGNELKEQRFSGNFRNRESILGDVVNSDPWFMGGFDDFGYSVLDGDEGSTYNAFKIKKASKPSVLIYSANDGMLHVVVADDFDKDKTTDSDSDGDATNDADIAGGKELFAYVPDSAFSNLSALTHPDYGCTTSVDCQHRYIVDGAAKGGDVYFDSDWHSVIVSSLGAGGKGIFAIDLTNANPAATAPATQFSATDILWEISTTQAISSADLAEFQANLGFTIPQSSIVKMHDGSWAAIVANGYKSADHKAVLFIIDIKTGEIITSIDTGVGDSSTPNGLSTPITVDENGDRIIDSIYAGDLLGNMWKFDVSNKLSSKWEVAYSAGSPAKDAPLFVACNEDPCVSTQPITAKPQVGNHPDGGLMVYFGTGKYFENGDNVVTSPQVQTFYGIRDTGSLVAGRDSLQSQSILAEEPLPSLGINIRVTTENSVDYSTKKGWYMDLISPVNGSEGERVIVGALLRAGRIIFTTLIPSADPCSAGGSSWLMELDAVTGGRLDTAPFDINGDGKFTLDDYVQIYDTNNDGNVDGGDDKLAPSGIQDDDQGIIKGAGVITCEDGTECKYTSGSSGEKKLVKESSDDPTGRQSWRQIR